MNEFIIESIVMAFVLGGIIGAAAALTLRNSRLWDSDNEYNHTATPVSIKENEHITRHHRR